MAAKAYTTIRPATRQQWLDIRGGGIGSSEVGAILGLNPYDTPYQVWRRKIGVDPAKPENLAMKAGHFLEDAVASYYADATGRRIIKRSVGDWIIRDNERPYMQVSPDRTYWLDDGKSKGILECKATRAKIDEDNIPHYWFAQLQYQLGVARLSKGSIAWLRGSDDFKYAEFNFSPEMFAHIVDAVDRFWNKNVKECIEPEPINVDDILLKFPTHTPDKQAQAAANVQVALTRLKDVRSQLADLEAKKKELEATVKAAFGDAERLVDLQGNTLATWKSTKPVTRFDKERLKTEQPTIYDKYCYESRGSRTLIIR